MSSDQEDCLVCGNTAESDCEHCETPYCGTECQTLDWPTHKATCIDASFPSKPTLTIAEYLSSHRTFKRLAERLKDVELYEMLNDPRAKYTVFALRSTVSNRRKAGLLAKPARSIYKTEDLKELLSLYIVPDREIKIPEDIPIAPRGKRNTYTEMVKGKITKFPFRQLVAKTFDGRNIVIANHYRYSLSGQTSAGRTITDYYDEPWAITIPATSVRGARSDSLYVDERKPIEDNDTLNIQTSNGIIHVVGRTLQTWY